MVFHTCLKCTPLSKNAHPVSGIVELLTGGCALYHFVSLLPNLVPSIDKKFLLVGGILFTLKRLETSDFLDFRRRLILFFFAAIEVFFHLPVNESGRVTSNRLTLDRGVHFSDKTLNI
jgi:hypothetical protein